MEGGGREREKGEDRGEINYVHSYFFKGHFYPRARDEEKAPSQQNALDSSLSAERERERERERVKTPSDISPIVCSHVSLNLIPSRKRTL